MAPTRALVYAADSAEPIPLAVSVRTIACRARSFEVPVYEHAALGSEKISTALCLAGGGSSGAVFARLAERAAARGVRAAAFDFPGHNPGTNTITRSTRARARMKRARGPILGLSSD